MIKSGVYILDLKDLCASFIGHICSYNLNLNRKGLPSFTSLEIIFEHKSFLYILKCISSEVWQIQHFSQRSCQLHCVCGA